MDTQSLYLLREPMKTVFGDVGYLSISDYIKMSSEISTVSKQPLHMYYEFRNQLEKIDESERSNFLREIESLKTISLIELVRTDNHVKSAYERFFEKLITYRDELTYEDILGDENYFTAIRKLSLEMNYLKEDPVSPNPEIQEYYEQRKIMKMKESGDINFSDIISSVSVGGGYKYEEIRDMTIFQFYHTYYRIGSFKKYDQSTIFASAFHDTKILTSWTEKIDLFKDEKLGFDYGEFNKKYNDIFS